MGGLPPDFAEQVVALVPVPLVVADAQGRILLFNPAAEAVLGFSAEEALGRVHVTDLYHRAEDARRVGERVHTRDALQRGAPETTDVTLRARNGELIPARLTARVLYDRDMPIGTLGFFSDRREQVALASRLEDAASQVVASERRAAGVATAADAAHEFAQPLTVAMGHLEMVELLDGVPAEARSRVARASEQLERLGRIVSTYASGGRRARA